MMKKISVILAFIALSLIIPAIAHAGGWDYQGSDVFTHQSKIFLSGGGDFKICLSSNSKSGYYELYDEDPFDRDDVVYSNGIRGLYYKTAGSHDFDSHGCHVFRNIGKYVDGDQAEFYLAKYSGGNSKVYAWD
ncbi:hypothetical protein [Fictibacillus terranigra]|uniref:Uncharacterized protein n=1 Tax=Fictibacillus terranigra TaxID=3058424 RepID=A0ABT8EC95_9BACL|nr:hypothetical protein [Fictibacillus sp. CENA-BCM004]MDN4075516.1 hypothetical protein [Fictibacillus sp. CENA-BCM004]